MYSKGDANVREVADLKLMNHLNNNVNSVADARSSLIYHATGMYVVRNMLIVRLPPKEMHLQKSTLFNLEGTQKKTEHYCIVFNTGNNDERGQAVLREIVFSSNILSENEDDLSHDEQFLNLLRIDMALLEQLDKISKDSKHPSREDAQRILKIVEAELENKANQYIDKIISTKGNHGPTLIKLANCYLHGEGVKKNVALSKLLYAYAATKGMSTKYSVAALLSLILEHRNKELEPIKLKCRECIKCIQTKSLGKDDKQSIDFCKKMNTEIDELSDISTAQDVLTRLKQVESAVCSIEMQAIKIEIDFLNTNSATFFKQGSKSNFDAKINKIISAVSNVPLEERGSVFSSHVLVRKELAEHRVNAGHKVSIENGELVADDGEKFSKSFYRVSDYIKAQQKALAPPIPDPRV